MVPKVSVLICARNAEQYVAEAVRSVLSQTFGDIEVLVIENGSTDGTWDVLNRETDSRLRLIRSDIPQLTFNLNLGLAHASAELVARMDADDIASPDRLGQQVQAMNEDAGVGVLGSWFDVFGEGVPTATIELPTEDRDIRKALPFRFAICHPTVMFRRKLVIELGGYEGLRFCEDLDLWLRMSRLPSVKFKNISKSLLRYRVHKRQARGSREAYAATSGTLLREGLMSGRIAPLAGAAWSWAKFSARKLSGAQGFVSL